MANHILADEIAKMDEDGDGPPPSTVTRVAKKAAEPAPAALSLTTEQFQQLLAAVQASGASAPDLTGIAESITRGMQQVAQPIPEQKIHHEISDLNPLGDVAHPRPDLQCAMWWGVIEDPDPRRPGSGVEIVRAWKMEPRDHTIWEILALNVLTPCDKRILRLDDVPLRVVVSGERHPDTGALQRLTLALPKNVIGKGGDNRNMVPNLPSIVYQLTGIDFRPQTWPVETHRDDLIWFLAEHRAKRYVSARPAAAAA